MSVDEGTITTPELIRWLRRVERKLDAVTNDHEQRIRKLERMLWVAAGMAAAGGGVLSRLIGG